MKTYEVNLGGNLSSAAKVAARKVGALVVAMGSLKSATLALSVATVALGAGLLGITGYALEASDRVNDLSASFGALRGEGPEAGRKTLESIRAIAAELPESERVISRWAQGLMAAGVTDLGQLRANLYAISGAERLVEGGGERVRNILQRLNEQSERGTKIRFNVAQLQGTGLSEQDLLKQLGMTPAQLDAAKKQATLTGTQIANAITNAINEKAHGPLERAMRDISTRVAKGGDIISHLFEGLDTSKIGQEITNFFGLFDAGSEGAAGSLKRGIGGALQWLADKMATGLRYARYFFEDLILWSLKAYIWFKKNFGLIREIVLGALAAIAVAVTAMAIQATVAFVTALPSLVAYTVMMGALAVASIIAEAPLYLLAAAIVAATVAIVHFWPQIKAAALAIGEWAQAGWNAAVDFVAGIVKGIVDGVGSVVSAVEQLGKTAWDKIRSIWDSHSPSRLTMRLGADIAEGQALGLESKQGRVEAAATTTLADAPARGASKASIPSARAGASAGGSVSMRNEFYITVNAKDSDTAREVYRMIEEEALASVQERLALTQGVAPVPA